MHRHIQSFQRHAEKTTGLCLVVFSFLRGGVGVVLLSYRVYEYLENPMRTG